MARLGGIDTQYFDNEGFPLSRGRLYCYETGTYTPKGTFHDSALTVPNTWPIELDAIGVPPDVFFTGTARFVLCDSSDAVIRELDPVTDNEFQTGDTIILRLGDIDSQFFDQNGDILALGKLYVYENGTSTPKDTYSDNALTTLNDWPVVLDSNGFLGDVFFEGKARLVLTDQHGVQQRELDDVDTFDISYIPGFILACPPDTYVEIGQTVSICVEVTGDEGDYIYQWYQDLTLLVGETGICLTLTIDAGDIETRVWVEVNDGASAELCGYAYIYLAEYACDAMELEFASRGFTGVDLWAPAGTFTWPFATDVTTGITKYRSYAQYIASPTIRTGFDGTGAGTGVRSATVSGWSYAEHIGYCDPMVYATNLQDSVSPNATLIPSGMVDNEDYTAIIIFTGYNGTTTFDHELLRNPGNFYRIYRSGPTSLGTQSCVATVRVASNGTGGQKITLTAGSGSSQSIVDVDCGNIASQWSMLTVKMYNTAEIYSTGFPRAGFSIGATIDITVTTAAGEVATGTATGYNRSFYAQAVTLISEETHTLYTQPNFVYDASTDTISSAYLGYAPGTTYDIPAIQLAFRRNFASYVP